MLRRFRVEAVNRRHMVVDRSAIRVCGRAGLQRDPPLLRLTEYAVVAERSVTMCIPSSTEGHSRRVNTHAPSWSSGGEAELMNDMSCVDQCASLDK